MDSRDAPNPPAPPCQGGVAASARLSPPLIRGGWEGLKGAASTHARLAFLIARLASPLLIAALGLTILLADPLALQGLRNGFFDQYQRWHPRERAEVPVRIIDIDEGSLERLGQWPWPRTRLAELTERLNAAGVAAIGFDIVFAEADRTSPGAAVDLWSLKGELRDALSQLPDHDRVFAQSIGKAPVVLGFALDRAPAASGAAAKPLARPYRFVNVGSPSESLMHHFPVVTPSLPLLEQAAQGNGALTFVPDSDGVIRRVPLVLAFADQPVSTLTTELLRVGQGQRNILLKAAEEKRTGLAEVRIGDFSVPTTAQGEMWVHYSAPSAAHGERYIPAWKVLAGEVPQALLENHLVLVGTSAQGLMDLRFSPLGRIIPGVEIHAQALEQVLSGHYLQRPSWATAAEALALLAACLLVGYVALRAKALSAAVLSAFCIAALTGGGWYAFRMHGLLLDSLTPAMVCLSSFVLCSLIHHFISEREQRWIKAAFSRYVSPNRVAHLIEHPDDIALGGHRQECSFIFTDLADFTGLMERIDPAEAVALLNAYLDQMIAIAFRHEGTLDRIVGDAVAIMFSAPVAQADHKARALACGLEMHEFSRRYAEDLQARGIAFGQTRIGIHSGEVIVGNVGGSTIFDYRALGDAVNTASRLEGANKYLGTHICVSAATLAGCPDGTAARPVGRLVLKGKSEALQVFEPVTTPDARAPIEEYRQAYALMAEDEAAPTGDSTSSALKTFQSLADRYPDDPLVALHLARLRDGQRGDLIVLDGK